MKINNILAFNQSIMGIDEFVEQGIEQGTVLRSHLHPLKPFICKRGFQTPFRNALKTHVECL